MVLIHNPCHGVTGVEVYAKNIKDVLTHTYMHRGHTLEDGAPTSICVKNPTQHVRLQLTSSHIPSIKHPSIVVACYLDY